MPCIRHFSFLSLRICFRWNLAIYQHIFYEAKSLFRSLNIPSWWDIYLIIAIIKLRERETHTQQVSDEVTNLRFLSFREPVFSRQCISMFSDLSSVSKSRLLQISHCSNTHTAHIRTCILSSLSPMFSLAHHSRTSTQLSLSIISSSRSVVLYYRCSRFVLFVPCTRLKKKGKKTGSRTDKKRRYVTSSKTCCVCVSLSLLAFLSLRKLFNH